MVAESSHGWLTGNPGDFNEIKGGESGKFGGNVSTNCRLGGNWDPGDVNESSDEKETSYASFWISETRKSGSPCKAAMCFRRLYNVRKRKRVRVAR